MTSLHDLPSGARHTLDAVAGVTAVASLANILPPIAAALSILWLLIQISEWVLGKVKKRQAPDE